MGGRLKPLAVMAAAEATPIFGFELPPCCWGRRSGGESWSLSFIRVSLFLPLFLFLVSSLHKSVKCTQGPSFKDVRKICGFWTPSLPLVCVSHNPSFAESGNPSSPLPLSADVLYGWSPKQTGSQSTFLNQKDTQRDREGTVGNGPVELCA